MLVQGVLDGIRHETQPESIRDIIVLARSANPVFWPHVHTKIHDDFIPTHYHPYDISLDRCCYCGYSAPAWYTYYILLFHIKDSIKHMQDRDILSVAK